MKRYKKKRTCRKAGGFVVPLVCVAAAAVITGGLLVMGRNVSDASGRKTGVDQVAAASLSSGSGREESKETRDTELRKTPGEDYSLTVKFRNGQETISGIFVDKLK